MMRTVFVRSGSYDGRTLGPRFQADLQLVLVHRGGANITIDDEPSFDVPAGEVALLLPGHRETFGFDGTHHSWIQAHVGAVGEPFTSLPRTLPLSAALARLVAEAVAVARAPLPTARPLLAALAAAAFWRYAGEAESGPALRDDAIDRARRHVDARLADPALDLGGLARAAHVSPPHLVRRFRTELGVTPMAYLWRRRVAHGVDLLTHTGLPVGEIASRSGFKSVYHFSRRVKEQTGLAPTAYLNSGLRQGWRGVVVVVVWRWSPWVPGLIWVRDLGVGDVMVDGSVHLE